MMAVAALAACSKSGIEYEPADEIGFQVVNGKMTKAVVEGTKYPDGLNMYVFAMTATETKDADGNVTTTPNSTANFLKNAEFAHISSTTLWGGWKDGKANPYYWPNVEKLCFAGISKSGNVNNGVIPVYENGVITVDGYVQDPANEYNDLMWFPTTPTAYGKDSDNVPVDMLHACSWVTIKLEGDGYTAGKYVVTDIKIDGLATEGKAELGQTATWTTKNSGQTFTVLANGTTALPKEGEATEKGFENTPGNTIVIPNQVPGKLSITYKFVTQAEVELEETVTGSLKFDGENRWQPGVHYTYTVKITAKQIYIQPEVTKWTPSPEEGSHGVTVQ